MHASPSSGHGGLLIDPVLAAPGRGMPRPYANALLPQQARAQRPLARLVFWRRTVTELANPYPIRRHRGHKMCRRLRRAPVAARRSRTAMASGLATWRGVTRIAPK